MRPSSGADELPVREALEPEQLDALARKTLREPRAGELRHRGRGARRLAVVEEIRGAQREEARARELAAEVGDQGPGPGEPIRLGEPRLELVEDPREPAELLGRDALEVERVHEHVPAAVDLPDEVLGRDLDAVEEYLAEVAAAEHGEAAHLDPWRVDRCDENGDAAMARLVGVRAHRKVDPVGEPGARRPDLVPVDDEAIARPHRARRQRSEVAARLGLREPLAERELTARDRPEQPLLECGRGEPLERAPDRLVREEVERERKPVVAEHVLDEGGVHVGEPAAAERFRPGHPDPARLPERAGDLARVAV